MPSSASTSATHTSTLSLHDALPISLRQMGCYSEEKLDRDFAVLRLLDMLPSLDPFLLREHLRNHEIEVAPCYFTISDGDQVRMHDLDRKSTRLNSSHLGISYAVFCFYVRHSHVHSFPTRRSSDLPSPDGLL